MGGRKAAKGARKMDGLEELFVHQNRTRAADKKAKQMANDDLFAINVDKKDLSKKRQKLAADRFHLKTRGQTPTEDLILKKLRLKNAPIKIEKTSELCDLWATAPLELSKHGEEYRVFAANKVEMTKVRQVMEAEGGHSFNPSADAHYKTLKKIVNREADDIEKKLRKDTHQQIANNRIARQQMKAEKADDEESSESVEEEPEDLEKIEVPQKAVDRLKKLTKPERNKRNEGLEKRRKEIIEKRERKFARQFDAVPAFIACDKRETKEDVKRWAAIDEVAKIEREAQANTGVITKYHTTGQFKYKMRKEDFQLEDELAASLRQMRSTGKHSMLREKQDDIFRTNKLESDAEYLGDRKRHRKLKFKMKARQGGAYGTLSEKLQKKNIKLKQANDDRENHAMMLQNDMIFI